MKTRITILGFFFCIFAIADLKILNKTSEFKQLIAQSNVPVLVQFSAYWCNPCQKLKTMLTQIAQDYTDDQVILAYIDAYENKDLKTYLLGGYPTVRTFWQGAVASRYFVGTQETQFVTDFIDSLIANPSGEGDSGFCLP